MMMMMLARVLHYIDETTDYHRAACLDVSALLNLTRSFDVCDSLP